jgi:hypothetical protein
VSVEIPMDIPAIEELLMLAFVIGVWWEVRSVVKFRSVTGAVFGIVVDKTLGDVQLGMKGYARTRVRVHQLKSSDLPVGLEFVTTTDSTWESSGVPITRNQALELSSLLWAGAGDDPPSRVVAPRKPPATGAA